VVVGGEVIDEKDIVAQEKKLTRTVGVRAGIVV
jgi:hypothetical protein